MLTKNENIINRKVTLLQKGFTLAKMAAQIGYSIPTISKAVNNQSKNSRDVHEKMVFVLGVSLAEFWPELYGPDVVNNNGNRKTVSHDSQINESLTVVN